MKKFLLGLAALTMAASAFGAVMSNTEIDDKKNGTTSVALPIKLEANIVDGSKRLFIEAESGDKVGDTLVLNFGDIARGMTGETEGRVRVFRGDTVNSNALTATKLGGNVDFDFVINGVATGVNGAAEVNKYYQLEMSSHKVPANGSGTQGGVITPDKINATIGITSISYSTGEMKDATEINARIKAQTEPIKYNAKEGKYYGSAAIVASLQITGAGVP